ncbi:MAG: hypothetical protein Q7S56_04230 [Nanoarchaeota archaeon]|nr:hypothetical protein [Nanoarchaeota archaeon]
MKYAYIIPGHSDSPKDKPYRKIASFFRKKGIKPIVVKIDWKYKLMSDYVAQFKKQVKQKPDYVLGFSWGAMIAFISAPEVKPRNLILCSFSPYFREDLPKIKDWWKKVTGKHNLENLKQFSFNKISRKVNSKIILLVGDKEGKEMERKTQETKRKFKNSKVIRISKVNHKISDPRYLDQIKTIINKL